MLHTYRVNDKPFIESLTSHKMANNTLHYTLSSGCLLISCSVNTLDDIAFSSGETTGCYDDGLICIECAHIDMR